MNQKQVQITNTSASRLERFSLGFEYDKTLQQVKHDIRSRIIG